MATQPNACLEPGFVVSNLPSVSPFSSSRWTVAFGRFLFRFVCALLSLCEDQGNSILNLCLSFAETMAPLLFKFEMGEGYAVA
jgi:hypothetical protein